MSATTSTVTLVYNGVAYELAPGLEIDTVDYMILERLNHIAHYRSRFERRPYNRGQAVLQDFDESGKLVIKQQFDPWEKFPLANGGHVRVLLHEGVNISLHVNEAIEEGDRRFEDKR